MLSHGRPPAGAIHFHLGRQKRLIRLIVGCRAGRRHLMMEKKFRLRRTRSGGPLHWNVERLDVGEDRRVLVARILEIERPLDRGKIVIFDADTADDQARLGSV